MKKLFTLMLMLFAVISSQAATPDKLYIVGQANVGIGNAGWTYTPATSGCMELTKSGNKFTASVTLTGTAWFCFAEQDGSSWDDFNDNYTWRPSSNNFIPTEGTPVTMKHDRSNSFQLGKGEYTFTVDFSGSAPTFTLSGKQDEVVITGYSVLGAKELFGGDGWEASEVDMTETSTGVYTTTISNVTLAAGDYEYKARANKEWGIAEYPAEGNNTLTIDEAGTYDITFTLTIASSTLVAQATKVGTEVPEDHIFVIGKFNGWDQDTAVELKKTSEGIFTGTVSLFAEDEFKILNKGNSTWYGGVVDNDGELHWVTADHHADIDLVDGANFYVENAGDYTFIVDLNNLKLTVESDVFTTQPNPETDLYVFGNGAFGNEGNWTFSPIADGTAIKMNFNSDGTYSYNVTVDSDSYFAFTTQDGTDWDDLNGNYRFAPETPDTTPTIGEPITLTHKDGSLHLGPGEYTLTVTLNGDQATLVVTGEAVEKPTIFTIVGDEALMGANWDVNDNEMKQMNDYWYTYTIAEKYLTAGDYEYKVTANHTWGVFEIPSQGNQTLTIEADGTYEVVFSLDLDSNSLTAVATLLGTEEPSPELYLRGSYNGWDANGSIVFEETTDENVFVATATLEAGATFKVWNKSNDKWYGGQIDDDGTEYWVTADNHTNIALVDGANFYVENAGEYEFTVDLNTMTLTVESEAFNGDNTDEPTSLYLVGSFNGWVEQDANYKFTYDEGNSEYFIEVQLNANDEVKFITENGDWYSNETQLELNETSGSFELALGGMGNNLVATNSGTYTFRVSSDFTYAVYEFAEEGEFVLPDCATYIEGKQFAYFEKPASWSEVYAYTWQDGGAAPVGLQKMSAAWPGDACEYVGLADNGNSVYRYAVDDADFDMIIFNDGGSNKTGDLNFTNGGYYRADGLKAVVDTSTDITGIEADVRDGKTKAYNLQGMEVSQLGRGIYIINGKKVLRK